VSAFVDKQEHGVIVSEKAEEFTHKL
jgi:hypothetical protein